MSNEDKKPEVASDASSKEIAVENGVKAAARFVAATTRDAKEFAELSDADFDAFMNGVRAAANAAVRADFPALRAHTEKESRDGFVLVFVDREDGNKKLSGRGFKIGAEKAPAKEQA